MKDVQGIQRGKCNICECSEYRTPSGDGVSCEYCGHRPGEHVQMVALGQCMTKDCDCDQYQSEDPNSYSKCCYCGCTASTHQGAEAGKRTQDWLAVHHVRAVVDGSRHTRGRAFAAVERAYIQ